jgi:L-aminopeptidase/D-esterase-like protein
MGTLTDIPGILVGHATNLEAATGCTVILCEQGAVPGVAIPGTATGTEETELLKPGHVTNRIHAVCFAGGSAFGLEAASGVRRFLEQKGIGFQTRSGPVPLVTGAILFDLGMARRGVRPTREMGEAAAAAASGKPVEEGAVGAGTGATVGHLLGADCMMKSGVGSASIQAGAARVAALAVVNAFGDVIDPANGRVVAGTRKSAQSSEFVNTGDAVLNGGASGFTNQHTTLVCVATDASFDRVQASKIAQMATAGMARTLSPAFAMSDGDIVIVLSAGSQKAPVDSIGVAAASVVAESILRAVRLAPSMHGVPGLRTT